MNNNNNHVFFILLVFVLTWAVKIIADTSLSHQRSPVAEGIMNKKCIDQERYALVDFKAHIRDPDGWLSTWRVEDDCCKWSGVTCNNQTGHVTQLNLENRGLNLGSRGLVGEISLSLFNLTYLTHLDLSYNSFKGIIPDSIGSLTKLRYLNLNFNSFHGTIPRSIGSLTKLENLTLGGNLFNGPILTSICSLTELRTLDLAGNSLSGTVPTSIGSLTQLRYLYLCYNSLNGTIHKSIGSLTELTDLDLSGNSFHGTILRYIASLTELSYLDLSGNSFHGTIPESIGSLNQLRRLDLSDNSFNGIIWSSIGCLTELRSLDLSNNYFTGTIPQELGNLTNLEDLSLGGDFGSLSIKNLDWFSHLSQLQFLYIDGISLAKADNWVNVILSLRKLSYLILNDCDLSEVMHPYSSSSFVNSSLSSSIENIFLINNNLNSSMYHWLFPLTSNNSLRCLDLSRNKLDMIPKYLGNLCSLTHLYLKGNSEAANFSDILNNLSGCTSHTLQRFDASGSRFTRSLSDAIQNFSSLDELNLSDNQLNETISEKLWELPNLQYVDLSSNYLRGAISQNIGNSKILHIDLSNNSLEGVPTKAHMSNLSYVEIIDLSSCKLGPRFPNWIQKLKNLTHLNIANTKISDTIPPEFWNMWSSRLIYLNLSLNNITGKVSNYNPTLSTIDLSFNNFYGPIPNVPSHLYLLDLSRNRFSGGISFLCKIVDGFFHYLDLSHNLFSGQIPDCLWHFKDLIVLNLGNNKLSGRIPASVESMIGLEVLYLYNNTFSGELPLSLKNCTRLNLLNLGENNFSGNLPVWIGENLSGLYALSLKSNNFIGPIPIQLCQLVHLQILDLSMNNLYGTIPSCVNNLTSMLQERFSSTQNVHNFVLRSSQNLSVYLEYVDHTMIQWQGHIQEFSINLGLLKSIDLSSNNLSGKIPYELTDLFGLVALNLSKNNLIGEIPQSVGQMKELLTLDLSRNNFSGKIPSSLSQMALLSYLDVSYNNLSGRVPTGSQLQTFEPSWFTGNAELCGLPATKHCPGDENLQVRPTVGESGDGGDVEDDLDRWFYIGGTSGFATGFWIVCSGLLLNRRGRHAFFSFHDSLRDRVYVNVMVFISYLESFAHA